MGKYWIGSWRTFRVMSPVGRSSALVRGVDPSRTALYYSPTPPGASETRSSAVARLALEQPDDAVHSFQIFGLRAENGREVVGQGAIAARRLRASLTIRFAASRRIGGLPYTVSEGLTGLLFDPGNAFDLAEKIGRLLDEPQLRNEMGLAGRRRLEEDLMWPDVIKRY